MEEEIREKISKLVEENKVILFMKGNKEQPRCGFSATVVKMLNDLNVEYFTFDILSNESMRTAIKEFSNWPTYPQLYFKSKLVGGCDIITEMFDNGDLQKLLQSE
jgi:monothiol glutaredoxin